MTRKHTVKQVTRATIPAPRAIRTGIATTTSAADAAFVDASSRCLTSQPWRRRLSQRCKQRLTRRRRTTRVSRHQRGMPPWSGKRRAERAAHPSSAYVEHCSARHQTNAQASWGTSRRRLTPPQTTCSAPFTPFFRCAVSRALSSPSHSHCGRVLGGLGWGTGCV